MGEEAGARDGAGRRVVLHRAMASASHALPELGPVLERCRIYAMVVLGHSPWCEDLEYLTGQLKAGKP